MRPHVAYTSYMRNDIVDRYQVIQRRDARYDGAFYFAVKTTGIFCKPSCPAPRPLEKNVVFYVTTREAEAAGFRPCKRCRPTVSLASRQAELLRSITGEGVPARPMSDRQVRRLVGKYFGAAPGSIVQVQRVMAAKEALVQTDLKVAVIAFLSGFESVRQFNTVFKRHTTLTPTQYRKRHG
jgi:AraC family transcriptional regulator, regulatory protein of adaptative response / DNA-3-methyladenine glycosylase II